MIDKDIPVTEKTVLGRTGIVMSERTAGILGNRATIKALVNKFAGEDGIVRCVSCESSEAIEWHHAIPLECGGKDVITNIFPVCHKCHMAIHYGIGSGTRRLEKARACITTRSGRKRSVPDNYKELLNDYVFCRIGKKELSARWGITVTSRKDPTKQIPVDMVRLVDKSWYRDYLKELGIKKVENHVDFVNGDLRNPRTFIRDGEYVGTITYLDGRVENLYKTS